MVSGFLDGVKFVPASSGMGDFVVSSAVTGYQTPASASAVDGTLYYYRAESIDLTQWEIGVGAYTVSTTKLARTTILFSSTGSKVSFSVAPNVSIVEAAEQLVNIPQTGPNVVVYASGSGTYTPTTGTKWIKIRMVGGGGGGAGSGTSPGAATGGGNTTFGSSLLTANGGNLGQAANGAAASGGTASGGDINIIGGDGGATSGAQTTAYGQRGGNSIFGGSGSGGYGSLTTVAPGNGVAAATNSGSGGGGAGDDATGGSGGGGGAGGYCEKLITSPSATYSYAVGAGGSGGTAGTNGAGGGAGGSGLITVEEHFSY